MATATRMIASLHDMLLSSAGQGRAGSDHAASTRTATVSLQWPVGSLTRRFAKSSRCRGVRIAGMASGSDDHDAGRAVASSSAAKGRPPRSVWLRYRSMPAAKQRSRSSRKACAVRAMTGVRTPCVAGGFAAAQPPGGLEPVDLRHLHVHQHDVERLLLPGGEGLLRRRRPPPPRVPSVAASPPRSAGSPRCPRPPGCAAGAAAPGMRRRSLPVGDRPRLGCGAASSGRVKKNRLPRPRPRSPVPAVRPATRPGGC